MTPSTTPDTNLPSGPIDLRLSVSGSLPGEALLVANLNLITKLFDAMDATTKQRVADDFGRQVDRAFAVWEKLLDHLHITKAQAS